MRVLLRAFRAVIKLVNDKDRRELSTCLLYKIHNLELRGLIELIHDVADVFLLRRAIDCRHQKNREELDTCVSQV